MARTDILPFATELTEALQGPCERPLKCARQTQPQPRGRSLSAREDRLPPWIAAPTALHNLGPCAASLQDVDPSSDDIQCFSSRVKAHSDSWGSRSRAMSTDSAVDDMCPDAFVGDNVADMAWREEDSTTCSDDGVFTKPPCFRVGEWVFRGNMTVLAGGPGMLSNSFVRVGHVTRGRGGALEKVAVKSVPLEGDEASVAMMRRECSILKELGDGHPHILPMLHCVERPATKELMLMTQFAEMGDLKGLHVNGTAMQEMQVRCLTMQVMSGLAYLHSRSIIHGDVKPENIFLTAVKDGLVALLSDFGLSTKLPPGVDSAFLDKVQGSHGYIAAEVIDGREVTCAIDLFAWGVVVWRLLSSYDPFYPASAVKSPLEYDDVCWDPVSEKARAFASKLLAVDAATRGSAETLAADPQGWLRCPEHELTGEARASYAPPVAPDTHFHNPETARALWEERRSRFAARKSDELQP